MTLGEYRVGIKFNPSNNSQVDAIKRAAADFIDLIQDPICFGDNYKVTSAADAFRRTVDAIDISEIPERHRLFEIALARATDAEAMKDAEIAAMVMEDAAMWAVKAATKEAYNA